MFDFVIKMALQIPLSETYRSLCLQNEWTGSEFENTDLTFYSLNDLDQVFALHCSLNVGAMPLISIGIKMP